MAFLFNQTFWAAGGYVPQSPGQTSPSPSTQYWPYFSQNLGSINFPFQFVRSGEADWATVYANVQGVFQIPQVDGSRGRLVWTFGRFEWCSEQSNDAITNSSSVFVGVPICLPESASDVTITPIIRVNDKDRFDAMNISLTNRASGAEIGTATNILSNMVNNFWTTGAGGQTHTQVGSLVNEMAITIEAIGTTDDANVGCTTFDIEKICVDWDDGE